MALSYLFLFLVFLETVERKEHAIGDCQNGKVIHLFSGKTSMADKTLSSLVAECWQVRQLSHF